MAKKRPKDASPIPRPPGAEWHKMAGTVPVRMTNDYLFRALMQYDNDTLTALTAALLHRNADEIASAEITNPILLGDSVADKQFILDIRVLLDGNTSLDLEMQVIKEADWVERSVGYLCRTYDSLNRGQAYVDANTAVQIGLLDFTLFPDDPGFFAVYMLTNTRSGRVYTDKFRLYSVDLTRADLATDEDKAYRIDQWARMFKATTWEELMMAAQQNPAIDKAVSSVYQLTEDERIRQQCEQREEFYIRREMEKRRMERMQHKLAETETDLQHTKGELRNTRGELQNALDEIARLKAQLGEA